MRTVLVSILRAAGYSGNVWTAVKEKIGIKDQEPNHAESRAGEFWGFSLSLERLTKSPPRQLKSSHCSFADSALASFRMGMSGSASFHDRVGVQLWLLPFADKLPETAVVDSPKPISGPEGLECRITCAGKKRK
jgi:hypothetical protein